MIFVDSVLVYSFYLVNVLNSEMASAASRRMKHFQFWMAFNALRWPTDRVSSGQVEIIKLLSIETCFQKINRK